MRSIIGTLIVGSLFAIGFVLFNGVGGDYELFDSGIVRSGWTWIGAALATIVGSLAAGAGVGEVVAEDPHGYPTTTRAYRPVAIVVALVLFGLAGFLLVGGMTSRFVDELAVGDCFDDPGEGEVSSVDVIPCDKPHDAEVYALAVLPGADNAPFPGEQRVIEQSDEFCLAEFDSFVGISYFDSVLDIGYFYPSRASWEEETDRGVTCALYRVDFQKMTGTARGSGQ